MYDDDHKGSASLFHAALALSCMTMTMRRRRRRTSKQEMSIFAISYQINTDIPGMLKSVGLKEVSGTKLVK